MSILKKALSKDWCHYYVWDRCCDAGNLCVDLKNQDKIFLSTLKKAQINIIKALERTPNTSDGQIFQFDFLNDDWKPQAEGSKILDKL